MNYHNKYLKYKNKYLKLKYKNNQSGGVISKVDTSTYDNLSNEELEEKANEGDKIAKEVLDKQYKAFTDYAKYKELEDHANKGDKIANYMLGKLHEMTGDYSAAREYYTLSSNQGYLLATDRLKAMVEGKYLERMYFSG